MREDMFKVIVERPRRGGGVQGEGRIWRNSRERGSHLGMKRGYDNRKWLNENLAPLQRWLRKQVHRTWDKVYAELSSGIDRRNTVQAHVFQHIDDFVERHGRMHEGEVLVPASSWARGGPLVPLRQAAHIELFVHPVTGILLPNRRLHEARAAQQAAWTARRGAGAQAAAFHVIDECRQWHRVEGCWFEVTLARFPAVKRAAATEPEEKFYDVLRRCLVTRGGAAHNHGGWYGRNDVYAVAKRQLSRREVRSRLVDEA